MLKLPCQYDGKPLDDEAMHRMRPNIAYVVNKIYQFMNALTQE